MFQIIRLTKCKHHLKSPTKNKLTNTDQENLVNDKKIDQN